MTLPHLRPAATALAILAAGLWGLARDARRLERQTIHALAPGLYQEKNQGAALQRAAFREPDLLPIYGSSELMLIEDYTAPFHASQLLAAYPTGFAIFPVGAPKNTCLLMLQKLAAVGPALRGRKLAISLSPSWFFRADAVDAPSYAGNFSALHAASLAFSGSLDLALKRGAARRMLDYPATLEREPLLRLALQALASGSPPARLLYYASLPLGRLRLLVLDLQDAWQVEGLVRSSEHPAPPRRRPGNLDWPALRSRAEEAYATHATDNPFGFDQTAWETDREELEPLPPARRKAALHGMLLHSLEWTDLDLLLSALDQLGARPLILSAPIHASFWEERGMPAADRTYYYDRVRAAAAAHGFTSAVFAEYEDDRLFAVDPWSHLSPKGWIVYAEALDAFFHAGAGRPEVAGDRPHALLSVDPDRPGVALRKG